MFLRGRLRTGIVLQELVAGNDCVRVRRAAGSNNEYIYPGQGTRGGGGFGAAEFGGIGALSP